MAEIDRDNEQFNQGVTHTVELLAKALGVEDWIAGDGSEDYDDDLSQTLLNILTVKGLYSPDDGAFAKLPDGPSPTVRRRRHIESISRPYSGTIRSASFTVFRHTRLN